MGGGRVIFWYGMIAALLVLVVVFTILMRTVKEARRISKQPGCYLCGSAALHVSAPSGWADPLLTHWNCVPHRCEVCYRRQYRFAPQPADDDGNVHRD